MTSSVSGAGTESSVDRSYLSPGQMDEGLPSRSRNIKYSGMIGGILLAVIVALIMPDDLSHEARMTAAVGILMGCWWVTEAVPLPATALVPIVLFPALDVADLGDFSGSYSNSIILMFLGGFLLALALQRWNLHKRIALHIVLLIGTRPTRLIAGFMIATAFLSMWVSNTATAMMMIPMGTSMVALVEAQDGMAKKSRFGVGIMLGIAYGATIGGFGTLIGSPVNVVIAAYIRESLNFPLTFVQWMSIGVPLMIVFLALGWLVIAKFLWKPEVDELPGGRELFEEQLKQLGKMSSGERVVSVVFLLTAAGWILVPLLFENPWADDTVIAMMAGLAVLLLPARPSKRVMVLTWEDAKEIPFGVLLLFGGGLALSSQITGTELSEWMGQSLSGLSGAPQWLLVLVIVALLLFLTEFTSSTATAAAFVPVVGGVALGMGQDPVVFAVAAGLTCMCAFMMPVGTPPNAIAFATGAITMPQMMKTGIWMNAIAIVLVTVISLTLVPLVLGS